MPICVTCGRNFAHLSEYPPDRCSDCDPTTEETPPSCSFCGNFGRRFERALGAPRWRWFRCLGCGREFALDHDGSLQMVVFRDGPPSA